jgi:hypothetical protein
LLDIIFIIAGILALVNTNSSMAKKFKLPYKYELQLHYLLFYHIFFSMFFTWYILNFGGDSYGYWKFGMEQVIIRDPTWMKYFGESTKFILWLCYFPSQVLGLSYITGNILFGFLGFIGIRYIFVMVADLFPANHSVLNVPLFPTVFYFLNLHFWSSGVGKDAICFWGIAWFLFALQQYRDRWWQAIFALFFVYMARPHMGLALLSGSGIAILLGSEIKPTIKIALSSVALIGAVYLSSSTLESLRLEDFSLETLEEFTGTKVNDLSKGKVGSGVDLASYSWPMKLFTYMFRPLFVDAHNIVSFFSSFENLLYLWLSLFIYRNWTPEAIRDMPLFIKAGMITFIPVTLAFMNSLSNLGIVMRMKNMTMIYFLLFCFFLIAYNKHLRMLKVQEKMKYYQKREEIIRKKAEATPPVSP